MAVRLPRLLNADLTERARLHPITCTINLVSPGLSEATMNIPPEDTQPAIHDWVELYNHNGSVGFFRVTGQSLSYTGETVLTLRHGIDTLSDSVYDAQQEYDGTVSSLLTAILNKQTIRIKGVKPWQLGTCADNTNIKRSLNYDNLKDLFTAIEDEKNNYYFSYDMTTWPWTVSFLAKPTAVAAEFRLHRNIQDIQVSLNDSELCTRLYLSVNVTTTTTPTADEQNDWPEVTTVDSVVRRYDNRDAQAIWGIVVKTASIDTDDDIQGQGFPSANAWAARYMQDHAEPTLQIQISGDELKQLTGDTFDEAKLGAICRVTLPDHDALFSQRIVAVSYPDPYGEPERVNVSLANRYPKVSTSISQHKQETAKAAGTAQTALRKAGGGGGGGGAAKELESWAMICKKAKEAEDATGLTQLYESGIVVDAETGVTIYSLNQGFESQYAELKVHSGEISTLVQTTGGMSSQITQQAGQITTLVQKTGINELGQNETMYSKITQTSDAITSEVTRATTAEGTLSSSISQNATQIALKVSKGDVSTQLSVECGNVSISGGNLVVSGYITSQGLITTMGNFTGNISATGSIAGQSLAGGSLTLNGESLTSHSITWIDADITMFAGDQNVDLRHSHAVSFSESGGVVTATIGAAQTSQGTATFNIAATQFYIDGVNAKRVPGGGFIVYNEVEYTSLKRVYFSLEAVANDGTIYNGTGTYYVDYTGSGGGGEAQVGGVYGDYTTMGKQVVVYYKTTNESNWHTVTKTIQVPDND